MEGYKRIVIEIPASIKSMLDEIVESKNMSMKLYLVTLIEREYLALLDDREKIDGKRACADTQ